MKPNAAKKSILVVDDTPANLRLLTNILSQQGYEVRPMLNGKLALMAVKAAPPQLILLDINMPEMNGYEVCRQLKADPHSHDIPVIFISALDEVMDKVKAFEVGGVDYITKPFQVEEVIMRVKTHLALQHLQEEIQAANDQLTLQVTELQRLNNRMHDELTLAREIQYSLLLPPQPTWPQLDVICYMNPAREVGGDFYKYYAFEPVSESRRFALAVGDVSGKGVSAALLMAVSLAQIDQALLQPFQGAARLAYLDKAIEPYTQPRHHNCALAYVELTFEPTGVTGLALNAGCIPPYLKSAQGRVTQMDLGGFALGQGLGARLGYQAEAFHLADNDMLILVSDGVVEANSHLGEMLGFERLQKIIDAGPHGTARAMLEHLKQAIAEFVGATEQHDDMTIVVVRVKNRNEL